MRIKHFELFNIGGYDGDEVALVFAVKFCRTQFAQLCKNAVPYDGKQFKGYKVVAVLLGIMKGAAAHGKGD